nr:E3 ubiquitin-protein ligase SINAT2 [Tanacetum cinerariifolium]
MVLSKKTKKPSRASSGVDEEHQMVLKNLYELLECPVCTTIMSPPIYQCPNGHTLCSICKFQVKSCCPICRIDMDSIRYSLTISANCQTLSWQGVPSSIRHSHKKLQDSLDGLVISPLLFSDGDKKGLNLIVHGRVWKE